MYEFLQFALLQDKCEEIFTSFFSLCLCVIFCFFLVFFFFCILFSHFFFFAFARLAFPIFILFKDYFQCYKEIKCV